MSTVSKTTNDLKDTLIIFRIDKGDLERLKSVKNLYLPKLPDLNNDTASIDAWDYAIAFLLNLRFEESREHYSKLMEEVQEIVSRITSKKVNKNPVPEPVKGTGFYTPMDIAPEEYSRQIEEDSNE